MRIRFLGRGSLSQKNRGREEVNSRGVISGGGFWERLPFQARGGSYRGRKGALVHTYHRGRRSPGKKRGAEDDCETFLRAAIDVKLFLIGKEAKKTY